MKEDPGIKVGDRITVTLSGKKYVCAVSDVATCVFGTTLPEGYIDVTDQIPDEKKGIRVGIKGKLSPV
jgi:hypothetical protein